LIKTGLSPKLAKEFISYKEEFNYKEYFARLEKYSIEFITYKDKKYPANLRGLEDAPLVLYVRGKLSSKDLNAIAVVGSRNMDVLEKGLREKLRKNK